MRIAGRSSKALDAALMFAQDDLKDLDKREVERVEQGQASERDATIEHVGALREFAVALGAQIDALAAKEQNAR